jgi:hypothetical protein
MKSFLIALVLGAIVSSTEAATTTAEVIIAWDTLVIETTGTLSLSPLFGEIDNTARAFDIDLNVLDVSTSLVGPAAVAVPGVGSATAGDSMNPYALASAELGVLDAASLQFDVYGIAGAGTVTASVDFSMVVDAPIGDPGFNFASADLYLDFFVADSFPLTSVSAVDRALLITFMGEPQEELNGILTATLEIPSTTEFSTISISGDVQARARANLIPVPATAWLLGSALGLLCWVRRRSV